MMKKTFLSLILLWLTCLSVQAVQENYEGEPLYASRWRDYQRNSYFGLRFGLNIPTIRYQGTGGHAQTDPLPRYHLGLIYGNKLGNGLPFFLETGLFYTEKGAKIQAWDELGYRKCTLRYLEVPLVLKYKLDTNIDDFSVQPFFGGFMAVGVGGNMKDYDYRTQNSPFGTSRYKRFDAGLRVGCGIAFQNFYFEMGDDIGLFNIAGRNYAEYNYDNFDGHIRTGNFIMSVGVNF